LFSEDAFNKEFGFGSFFSPFLEAIFIRNVSDYFKMAQRCLFTIYCFRFNLSFRAFY